MLTWSATKSKIKKWGKLDFNMTKVIDSVYNKKTLKKLTINNKKDLNMAIRHRLGQKTKQKNNKQKQKVENLKNQK